MHGLLLGHGFEVGTLTMKTGARHSTGFEMAFQAYPSTTTPAKHPYTTLTTATTSIIDYCYYLLCLIEEYLRYCPSFSRLAISS